MRQLGPDAVKNKINKYLKKNQQDVIFLKKIPKKKRKKLQGGAERIQRGEKECILYGSIYVNFKPDQLISHDKRSK